MEGSRGGELGQGIAKRGDGRNQGGGHQVGRNAGDTGEVPWLVINRSSRSRDGDKERRPRDRGKRGGTRDGQVNSSHRASSCEPVTVPQPAALWNRACGGQFGLN